jgi:hypothetical protein
MASIAILLPASPKRMMAPLPNCFSIPETANSKARSRSGVARSAALLSTATPLVAAAAFVALLGRVPRVAAVAVSMLPTCSATVVPFVAVAITPTILSYSTNRLRP